MFCTLQAWHDVEKEPHKLYCGHSQSGGNSKIDIVFCVDVTGSMDDYLDGVIDTIKLLVKGQRKTNKDIRYSFVGYRDH